MDVKPLGLDLQQKAFLDQYCKWSPEKTEDGKEILRSEEMEEIQAKDLMTRINKCSRGLAVLYPQAAEQKKRKRLNYLIISNNKNIPYDSCFSEERDAENAPHNIINTFFEIPRKNFESGKEEKKLILHLSQENVTPDEKIISNYNRNRKTVKTYQDVVRKQNKALRDAQARRDEESDNPEWEKSSTLKSKAKDPKEPSMVLNENDLSDNLEEVAQKVLGKVGIASGIGRRNGMEDAHLATVIKVHSKLVGLYGIFDGHSRNGTDGFKFASYMATHLPSYLERTLNEAYEKKLTSELKEVEIFNILKLAFVHLGEQCFKAFLSVDGGTTACVVLRFEKKLVCFNLGDSRALVSQDNQFIALSEDANPSVPKFAKGVKNRGALIMYDRVMISKGENNSSIAVARSVGHDEETGINPRAIPLTFRLNLAAYKKNYLAIVCDGVSGVASSRQIAKTIQDCAERDQSCKEIAENLFYKAYNCLKEAWDRKTGEKKIVSNGDNISVLIVDLSPPEASEDDLDLTQPLEKDD